MRHLHRMIVFLCGFYLLVLLVFHQRLIVTNENYADNIVMNYDADLPVVASASNNGSKTPTNADMLRQLASLESGMLQLEQEILKVKVALTQETLARQQVQQKVDLLRTERRQETVQGQQQGAAESGKVEPKHVPVPTLKKEEPKQDPVEDYKNTSLLKVADGLAVYSAYHDDRLETSWVRLIIMLSAAPPNRRVLCHFEYVESGTTYSTEAEQYEMCENHRKKYSGFLFSCRVPLGTSLAYKLYLSSVHSNSSRVLVPVQGVTPSGVSKEELDEGRFRFAYNYSVCVSPLFGSVNAIRLVEFMELTRILGVQQVFFYDFQTSSTVQRFLSHYVKKGWVTVLPWTLPAFMTNDIWYNGQLITNNDCLYRNMATSALTAFHDIDEFIVPRTEDARTLLDIIPTMLPNDTSGYSFQSAFFDPGVPTAFPDDLMTVALTARSVELSNVRRKVLVAPRRIFEIGIHHISKQLLEPWASRPFTPSKVLLHHYRECIRDFGMKCDQWVKDTIIKDKYWEELKTNVAFTIKLLKL